MRDVNRMWHRLLFLLVLLMPAPVMAQSTITMGDTTVETDGDGGNGNLLLAQQASLSMPATLNSLSFNVMTKAGNLKLAVYDASGTNGKPGKLLAQTASFATANGWNTHPTTTQPLLAPGNYWLVYLPSSSNLTFWKQNSSGPCYYYTHSFSLGFPAKFATTLNDCTPTTWSFYATLTPQSVSPPTLNLVLSPSPASVAADASVGTGVAQAAASWSDGSTFTGSVALTNNDGGLFTINGSEIATNASLLSDANTVQEVTGQATQGTTTSQPVNLSINVGPPSGGGGGGNFTALHTYFMSTTGSDSNNGLSASSPWASPNHNLVCGDVIVAAPGAYPQGGFQNWGAVTSCPSTSGGIDGSGGIYFATVLCAGNVGACSIDYTGQGGAAFEMSSSNWAVEGWKVTSAAGRAFEAIACDSGSDIVHHIAFVNDIATGTQDGFDTNDCAINHSVPGNGVDYFAVVGSIAQNAANDPICLAAIDDAGPANWDSAAGTHVFWAGDFAINNQVACGSDGEGMMFDTWDAHGYTGQGVIEQNMVWGSERFGLQLFYQAYNASAPNVRVFNNTFYDNNVGSHTGGGFADGDINVQSTVGNLPWNIQIYNNIVRTGAASSPGAGDIYAGLTGGVYNTTWSNNIMKGLATHCDDTCDPGNNVVAFNGGSFGTNTYVDPSFANTTDLLNNRGGPPNCGSFTNVNSCMAMAIADLTPTASGTAGLGYQSPGPCAADPYYPVWLKGIVYLQWNGTSLSESSGLLTKPCGM